MPGKLNVLFGLIRHPAKDELILPSAHNLNLDGFSIQYCCKAQVELSSEMAKLFPDFTIPFLSGEFSIFVFTTLMFIFLVFLYSIYKCTLDELKKQKIYN